MENLHVLVTFAGGLGAALVLGYLAKRLKLSPILGYLLAGIAVGPFTPGFVADRNVAEQFAEIGVILLLFGVGLRFDLKELLAVWRIAIPGALIQSAASTGALALAMRAMGWSWESGLVLGMAISVASTVVMALVLAEQRDLNSQIGHIAIGWTVVEDLLTVTILLLLPVLYAPAASQSGNGVASALGVAGLKILALVVVVAVMGRWVIPAVLEKIEKTRSRELFTLCVLVLAIGIAIGASAVFGVSIALGAFLAGLAVGRSEFAARAAYDALPMRDAFAVLFFVSVGMLVDPRALADAPMLTAAVLAVVVVGKPLAATATVRLLGVPLETAVPVGATFSQVGEFSFILGSLARQMGLLGDVGWDALVAASIISIGLNPSIYRLARRSSRRRAGVSVAPTPKQPIDPRRCILVGYGPVGRTAHRILSELGTKTTIVELNLETVRLLKSQDVDAIYGDVLRPGTLEEAGIARAGTLVLSAEIEDGPEVVRQARVANPELRVLARCSHLRDADLLRRAGATVIVGEAEIAVALAQASLGGNEAALKAFAQHRDRIRDRLYERVAPPSAS